MGADMSNFSRTLMIPTTKPQNGLAQCQAARCTPMIHYISKHYPLLCKLRLTRTLQLATSIS